MRCLHCQAEGVAATATTCPACGVYLPSLLRDVLPAGTTLRGGAYRLDYPLGRGGFGITYRAVHASLEQVVAIKEFYPQEHAYREGTTGRLSIPTTQQGNYERGLTRFIREGRLLARLKHPGIVRVSDLFEERGTAYLVMDLVSGRSLRAELDAQPDHRLPTARVEQLVAQVVAALSAVHAQEVYHLDISPENILLTADGRAVLVDFGAARQGFSKMSTQAFRLEYAAPEVLAGKEVGPQSDLFELAMVVYELLRGSQAPSAMDRLLEDHLDLTGINEPWRSLLAEALRVQAAERPANVTAWWGTVPASTSVAPGVSSSARPTSSTGAAGGAVEVRVASDGSGDYAGLAEAVRQVSAGTVVRLGPGEHRLAEPLTIDKTLTLLGAGMDRTSVVCGGKGGVVRLVGEGPIVVQDVAFVHEGRTAAHVVEATARDLRVEGCRFTGAMLDETGARSGVGLHLHGGTCAIVTRCEATANQSHGIFVGEQAAPTLEANRCEQNKDCGIGYAGSAAGTARQNTCQANEHHGIWVGGSGQPLLDNNTCRQNTWSGIGYAGSAAGTARQNTCAENQQQGLYVGGQAQPTLEANRCEQNKDCGIGYAGSAAGTARQNTCQANEHHGIWVGGSGQPLLDNNTCRQNTWSGIGYAGSAAGTARQNTCAENQQQGLYVGGQAQPTLEANTCRLNKLEGLGYYGTAAGTARQNICAENAEQGIYIQGRAAPTLVGNTCERNTGYGMAYFESAAGTARQNICRSNGKHGIYVAPSAGPHLEGNIT